MSEEINILSPENQGNVFYGPEIDIDVALAAGVNVLVAGVANAQIQIMSFILGVEKPCTIWLRTGTTNRLPIPVGGKGGLSFLQGQRPIFYSKVGSDINLNITGDPGTNAGVLITYRLAKQT
jgi:hypothetical protein